MELFEAITKMDEKLDRIESKIDAINCAAVNGSKEVTKAPAKGKSKATKATKKSDDYEVVATREENIQKVYKAMGYKKGDSFDRKKYEATAKKLGVWSDNKHRVVGTYK
jgi:hypothetical protein